MINPYEPPQELVEIVEPVPDTYGGYWRDQAFLVIDTRVPKRLPLRCVLTGVDVSEADRIKMRVYFRGTTSESSIELYWPIARNARPERQFGNYIGWGLVVVGASIIMGDFISTIGPYAGLSLKLPAQLTYTGVGLVAAGIGFLKLRLWYPLALHRRNGNFAWVQDVHPDFLKHLPPWPEPPYE
jgi:hypothetical protein